MPASRFLKKVFLAVDGDFLLAVLNDGAKTRLGKHTAQACACGTDLLGQGALRLERHVELAGIHLVDSVVVGANMRGNEVLDLMIGNQLADTDLGIGGIVADDGQVFNALLNQCVNQGNRVANSKEATHHNGHSVVDFLGCLLYRNKFVHKYLF